MPGLVEAASGILQRRLLLTVWLPVVTFCMAVGAVAASGVGWRRTLRAWEGLSAGTQVLVPLGTLLASIAAAQFLWGQLGTVTGWFEGDWDGLPGGRRLANRCRARCLAERNAVPLPDSTVWPARERVAPTRFGNRQRAVTEYPLRYGMDAVTAWPRLYVTLPDTFTATLASAAADVELMVVTSFLGFGFALVGGALAVFLLPWYWAPVCVWAGAVVAWAGHRGASRALVPYTDLVRTAFDVYRWGLLDAMGLSRPPTYVAEHHQWDQLHKIWQQGAPDTTGTPLLGYPGNSAPRLSGAKPAQPPTPTPPALPAPLNLPRRLLVLTVAAGVLAGAAAVGREHADGPPPRTVASRELPAYHQLTSADLKGDARKYLNRYTLKPLEKGTPLTGKALGPALAPGLLSRRVVMTLPVQALPPDVAGRAVILVAGTGGKPGKPLRIDDAVALGEAAGGRLVVALDDKWVAPLAVAGSPVRVVLQGQ